MKKMKHTEEKIIAAVKQMEAGTSSGGARSGRSNWFTSSQAGRCRTGTSKVSTAVCGTSV